MSRVGRLCRLDQRHCGWGRRVQEVSQRPPWAVDSHHPLRAFAPLDFANAGTPVFAGATLPAAKASDQTRWPWTSSWPRHARQAFRPISCSSPSCRRRQPVRGEGYRLGQSFQRAPVRQIHRIPAKQGRAGGVCPPHGEAWVSGSQGAIFSHCSSVSSEGSLALFYLLSITWHTSKE
jgi:hypothetical protein